jgi:hypothetical protein
MKSCSASEQTYAIRLRVRISDFGSAALCPSVVFFCIDAASTPLFVLYVFFVVTFFPAFLCGLRASAVDQLSPTHADSRM